MLYEEQEKAIDLMKQAVKYIKMAHDEAETKHDSYGDDYMEGGLYEIMQDTEKLIHNMVEIINGFEEENGKSKDGE